MSGVGGARGLGQPIRSSHHLARLLIGQDVVSEGLLVDAEELLVHSVEVVRERLERLVHVLQLEWRKIS